ncbi:MAG TPA: NAD(P)-binding protein, partial [Pararobbsia sp.]|nr:NAD(P)-binding protein [Pararobbsia sp.]
MNRRSFLLASAAASLASCGRSGWFETTPVIDSPGMLEGHALRDARALPSPSGTIETDIAILGSGAAGLSCAWQLARAGRTNFVMLAGPEFGGNAAGGRFGDLGYPKGAHYLPLPSMASTHLRDMLSDLGVIESAPFEQRPFYDERVVVHAPDERLMINGRWQDGLLPMNGVRREEIAEQSRFFAFSDSLRTLRGNDNRKVFCIPVAESSRDPHWTSLDKQSFKQWLERSGYSAPTLHWYLDYCCRDDFGAGYEHVSAWAGLHYFAARDGHAANAEDGATLTWPDGLHRMVDKLCASINARQARQSAKAWTQPGFAVRVDERGGHVEALCARIDSQGQITTFMVRARRMVCAMPLFVAAHVVSGLHDYW